MKVIRRWMAAALMAALLMTTVPARAEENHKLLALTFDDGPGPYTEALLDGLAGRGAYCTFFMVGWRSAAQPELLRRMVWEGHQIANHTYDHAWLDLSNAASEVAGGRAPLAAAAGEQTYFVRPPYGSATAAVRALFDAPAILWSVDPEDWRTDDTATTVRRVVNGATDGDIILLHDSHRSSCEAALTIIDRLQAQGYEFVTVSELLRRRGIAPRNGEAYYSARNTGADLPAADTGIYEDRRLSRHWGYEAIRYALDRGYFAQPGDGVFRPDAAMTRAAFVTVLANRAGEPPEAAEPLFEDVPAEHWAAPYVAWAAENGITAGISDGDKPLFCPDLPLSREQMAVMLRLYLDKLGVEWAGSAPPDWTDADAISDWARESIDLCASLGVLSGNGGGAFRPKGLVTRAEAASLLMHLDAFLNDRA